MFVQQIALDRGFLPPSSPRTHTHTHTHTCARAITESRTLHANSSFKTQKRKFTQAASQLALLRLRCELHKFYSKWPTTSGCSNRYWRNPHEDHSREKRPGRGVKHCCQRRELSALVTSSLQPSVLEERN